MILKTGACFTAELELNCPTIVDCVTALPVGPAAVAGTTQVLGKDGQYHTLPAAPVAGPAQDPYATPAQTVAGTATALIVNPADLVARENIPAQTGLSNDVSAIPAPAANQSPWGVNLLGETLHYAPGLGWQIVDKKYGYSEQGPIADTSMLLIPLTMPRAGFITVSAFASSTGGSGAGFEADLFVNINPGATLGTVVATDRSVYHIPAETVGANFSSSCAASRVPVTTGQVVTFAVRNTTPSSTSDVYRIAYAYE
jgi:hypothetical protein